MNGAKELKEELLDLTNNMDDWIEEKDWLPLKNALRTCAKKLSDFQFEVALDSNCIFNKVER
jgi:hypothetical protein